MTSLNRNFLDRPEVARFDSAADRALDYLRGNALADRGFYALSEAANHSILWHACTWVPVLFAKRAPQNAVAISIALAIESGVVNGLIKQVFRRERPTVEDARPHKLRQPKTSSFPSGHATSAFCAALLLGRGRSLPLWFGLAGAVGISRIYVRIHHASDVLGGVAIGLSFGAVGRRVLSRIFSKH